MDAKSIRRPLTDTLVHGDSLAHPLEPKPLLLHTRPETKSVSSDSQQDRSRKTVGLSDMKLMQTEINYTNGKHYSASNYV